MCFFLDVLASFDRVLERIGFGRILLSFDDEPAIVVAVIDDVEDRTEVEVAIARDREHACADACEVNPAATAFHYRLQAQQLHIVRRQFIPDGASGCVIELTVENQRQAPRMVEVSFTVRTDILTVAAARGEDGMELGRDVAEYDEATQAFYARDSRNPWHALWGADENCRVLQADLPQTVYGFGNTRGKGVNGRLFYRLRVNAGAQATMRLFVAGGFASRSKAEDALAALRAHAGEKGSAVAVLKDGGLTLTDSTLDGSYLVFEGDANGAYAILRRDLTGLYIVLGLAGILLILVLIRIRLRRKRARRKQTQPPEHAPEHASEPEHAPEHAQTK